MASGEGKAWKFAQVGGDQDTFTLSGWSAPFGRARQGAVVKTTLKVRTERVYYPGSNSPTRHVFGSKEDDWELKGRWRDRALGKGGAQAKARAAKLFVGAFQPVQISWGDILVYTGFIAELELGNESESEIEWTFRIEIDSDDTTTSSTTIHGPSVGDFSGALGDALNELSGAIALPKLPGSLGDVMDSAVDAFRSATGSVRSAIDQVASFKDATFAQINRAVSGVSELRGAGIELREAFLSIPSDAHGVGQRASDIVKLQAAQTSVEDQIRASLSVGAQIERGAELARIGRIKATFVAGDGDTWEAVSSRVYGSPDRAGDLREANNVSPGQNPVPGTMYLIPR
jgi:hypothetical protein